MSGPTPYLACRNAAAAIDFYTRAFGAEVRERYVDTDGRIGHAELRFEAGALMLADEYPEIGFRSPTTLGGAPLHLHLGVADVDAAFRRARDAGAQVVKEPTDEEHGGRRCKLLDPFGFTWSLSASGSGA
jgi:PhnB protein